MSLTLFLLNKKGYLSLLSLIENNKSHIVEQVFTSNDKGNKEDFCEEIISLCESNNINVSLRQNYNKVESKFSIAIGWRWLIPNVANLIVIHDSILPKYRGFSPLPNMLIKGEETIGATAIFATELMDEGDIIFQEGIKISYPIKIYDAIELVSEAYVKIVLRLVQYIENNQEFPRLPQCQDSSTYSIWRDEEDYYIDWNLDSESIVRFVDAVGYPFDIAKTRMTSGESLKILRVESVEKYSFEIIHPGKILTIEDGCPIVICGKNAIKIIEAVDMNDNPFIFNKLRTRFK